MFKKRIIAIVALPFATALLLGSTLTISNNPTCVSAASETHNHNGWTGVSTLPTDEGSYYLTDDITLSSTWNVPSGETNLCLNGHVIDANNGDFNSITIGGDATLNLYDCGSESHNGYIDSDGVWHLGTGEGIQKSITGGIITGANKQSGSGYGGAINNKGSLNMYGGNIVGNLSTKTGAGIYSDGNLNIFSGNIIYNKTTSQGGGVSISNNPNNTFNMYGGNIDYNIANNAGGVFINRAEVRLSGGTIMNNIATSSYGGMMVGPNVFSIILGGSLNVSGNTAGIGDNKVNSNAYINGAGKVFNIGTKTELDEGNGVLCPTDEMNVGVTLGSSKGQFTNTGVPDLSANFFSDNGNYLVKYNDETESSEYLELKEITIADILPDDFPTSEAYAWRSDSNKLYLLDSSLYVTGSESGSVGNLSSIVIKNGNTYVYDPELGATLTFNMSETDNSILQSITISEDELFNGTYVAPHIHNFSYVANDNAITATCEEGCTEGWDEDPLTLTLVSPANLSYDGNEKNVTFISGEENAWTAAGLELPDITYLIKESGATEYSSFSGIPTNAGDFMAKITVDGKEAKLQFTIGKATPYIKTLPEPNDIELGKKLSDSTLVGGYVQVSETDTTEVPGTFEWTEPNRTPILADSEVTLFNVTFTPVHEENFNKVSCQVMIRINHTHIPTKVNGQAPTETTPGWKDYYECSCGALYEDESGNTPINNLTSWKAEGGNGYLAPLGHNYVFIEFVWDEFTAQAKYVCSYDSSHFVYYTATVSSEVTTQPTCTTTGVRTYTASYEGHTDTKTETIQATNHSLVPQEGKTPTCTEDGYMEAYYCSNCGKYFTDPSGEYLIGDLTAYNNWKLNEGKIAARHIVNRVAGLDPTSERSGYKEAWKCSECGEYFEDEACTILIGDEVAYNAWKLNEGFLPQLPGEGLSGGAIAGICVGALFLLLVIIYLIGYFFSYRKGKLDDKKIKVIYKILPRGEQKLEKND